MPRKQNKGFTLLEILLVIAAIGILASIVLVAINPNRQLAQVRNAQRRSDINTIYKALEQYLIDTGSYPNSINTNFKEICNTGSQKSTDTLNPLTLCDNKADLRVLVPNYVASIPIAPSGGVYRVGLNSNNRIAVYTIGENSQTIAINFAVTNYGIIDVDAFNYITAIETADGQALEDNVKIAINNFVIGLKTDGIWEPIKASVIMAGARTLNGALIPLKGPAPTNFNFVAGDYNRKTGLVGNGGNKILNTNRPQSSDLQNNNHFSYYSTTTPTTYTTRIAGSSFHGFYQANATSFVAYNMGGIDYVDRLSLPGFHGMARSNPSSFQGRAASVQFSVSRVSNIPPVGVMYGIFGEASGGSSSNARIAFYSIGESLDLALLDARVTALVNALAVVIP